jgi:hypothetical protein
MQARAAAGLAAAAATRARALIDGLGSEAADLPALRLAADMLADDREEAAATFDRALAAHDHAAIQERDARGCLDAILVEARTLRGLREATWLCPACRASLERQIGGGGEQEVEARAVLARATDDRSIAEAACETARLAQEAAVVAVERTAARLRAAPARRHLSHPQPPGRAAQLLLPPDQSRHPGA